MATLQINLTDFFKKKPRVESAPPNISASSDSGANKIPADNVLSDDSNPEASNENSISPNDIKNYIGQRITTESLHKFSSIWRPSKDYKYPGSKISQVKHGLDKSYELRFPESWFHRYPWLSYSKTDSAFCKYCVFFAKNSTTVSTQNLGMLLNEGFNRWKNARETFRYHETLKYHQQSIIDAERFMKTLEAPELDIANQLNESRLQQIKLNRQRLISIIQTVIFCGRQEIALRGHRDSGDMDFSSDPKVNEGNFRAALRYRAQGDDQLKEVLSKSGQKYLSPRIQNEIADTINNLFVRKIVQEVNTAQCFSLLADGFSRTGSIFFLGEDDFYQLHCPESIGSSTHKGPIDSQ